MMLAPNVENATPFSLEALTPLYQKLDFPTRARIIEIFFLEYAQLPKRNPSYPSSIFPNQAKQIVSIISYTLG